MKQNLKVLIYTLLGNTMLAFAVCAFIVPQDFMLGRLQRHRPDGAAFSAHPPVRHHRRH